MQAVMRVKLEQASKVKMWTPTRLRNGEGRAGREETNKHLFRSAGVVSTACKEGGPGQWGRLGAGRRVAPPNVAGKGGGPSERRKGPYDR
jgi:hypothetical protein